LFKKFHINASKEKSDYPAAHLQKKKKRMKGSLAFFSQGAVKPAER